MPTIAFIKGIRIEMRQESKEHNPPHIHATYDGFQASFNIYNGTILRGMFPKKEMRTVSKYIIKNKEELLIMWETQIIRSTRR